jgi:trans-aconitate 2-methyltransferase
MSWDPSTYLRFADHRARPGLELLSRVRHESPARVADLGCGTGNLTTVLAQRWPAASVTGVDASPEMLATARASDTAIDWIEADLSVWEPENPFDVVFSNATLHWLDEHQRLFPRIAAWVAPGGTLAIQMPDNWSEPTHRIPARIIDEPQWPEEARRALMRDRLRTPGEYRLWLASVFDDIDMWTTTYHQVLEGPDPVLTWVEGSVLRPVLAALSESQAEAFEQRCRAAYAEAYPPESDGTTILPFRRFFIVATDRQVLTRAIDAASPPSAPG